MIKIDWRLFLYFEGIFGHQFLFGTGVTVNGRAAYFMVFRDLHNIDNNNYKARIDWSWKI